MTTTSRTLLTGITTTGIPHLGNYVGAIRPAIAASQESSGEAYFFLADYHALIKCQQPERLRQSTLAVAAAWLACGLDPQRAILYRQSDVPEITELCWILACVTAKGLMNRAHAYKAKVQENEEANDDPDKGVTMGLYAYPVLMAADILLFNATHVPVGQDQLQHLEMTRDIGQRFNHLFAPLFQLPEAIVTDTSAVLRGLDGRKMSKSYDNTIPLLASESQLRKLVFRIKTNSQPPEEPKDPDDSILFELYRAFASPEDTEALRQRYQTGVGWGEVKQLLFECLNSQLQGPRAEYERLMAHPEEVEQILIQGAARARERAQARLVDIRQAVGIGPLA